MKIYSIALISLLVLAGCQKAADRAADDAAKPKQDKPTPVATNVTTGTNVCVTKEVVKETDKDGKVKNTISDTNYKSISISEFVEKKDGVNYYNVTGEFTSEYTEKIDDKIEPVFKTDYTYKGTRTSKTQEIDSKNFKVYQTRKYTQTGRNGYKFYVGKDKPKSDTRIVDSQTQMTVFDDGAVTYLTDYSYTSNGKTVNFEESGEGNYITNYKTEAGVTTSVTKLKQPVVTNHKDGSVHELLVDDTTCTETITKSQK
ncbi:hypothetical protein K2P97_03720 [bacterium]|nr:hypothetical protein [bacterium]